MLHSRHVGECAEHSYIQEVSILSGKYTANLKNVESSKLFKLYLNDKVYYFRNFKISATLFKITETY